MAADRRNPNPRPHPQTGPLSSSARTGPLRSEDEELEALAEAIAQANKAITTVEPRIELLARACEAAGLRVPGRDEEPYHHPLSGNGAGIVQYLAPVFQGNQELARRVQVALQRFYDTKRLAYSAQEALDVRWVGDNYAQLLRRGSYQMMHYYEEFRQDPVLVQVFPQATLPKPQTPAGPQEPAAEAPDRKNAAQKQLAQRVLDRIKPWLPILRALAPGGTKPRIFDAAARPLRLLTLRLQGSAEAAALLGKLLEAHDKLEAAIADGTGDLGVLTHELGELTASCRRHPLLADILTLAGDTKPGLSS